MDKFRLKIKRYQRRKLSVKRKIKLNSGKCRLCISRSNKNFYAQIIDDKVARTMVSASTLEKDFPKLKSNSNIAAAKVLGKILAERAVKNGIDSVVFDRNGYLYHGGVKAFADAARENGLKF
jgi:large subunit ribosomal protein L18